MKTPFRTIGPTIALTLLAVTFAAVAATACLQGIARKADPGKTALIIDDLNRYSASSCELCRRYEHYADRASADGNRMAAGLFSALARSERIHENACLKAASLLNGKCRTSPPAGIEVTDTKSNLQRSLNDERSRLSSLQGSAAEHAIDARDFYTARILIWIDGTNRRHIELIERCLQLAEREEPCDGGIYHVCPVCGNVYEAGNCDIYCPICRTRSSEFECFGRLQVNKAVVKGIDN